MGNIKGIIIAVVLIVIIGGMALYFKNNSTNKPSASSQPTQGTTITNVPTQMEKTSVPLPTEEDTIRTFFNLINEHRAADAVSMMAPEIISDDSQKQAWAVQFNAFSKVTVSAIEPALKEEWIDTKHEYKVVLDVSMKEESANAVIPYYGYDNGQNFRWVIIKKVGENWRILEIGTGP